MNRYLKKTEQNFELPSLTSAASELFRGLVKKIWVSAADRNWRNAFDELISPTPCIRFARGLHRVEGPFNEAT